jgi:hypothetical protein
MEYLNLSFHLFSLLSGAKVQKSFVKNTRMGVKNAICNKKIPKYLELIENVFIFAPSEYLFWLSG